MACGLEPTEINLCTRAIISDEDRSLVRGFVINKFRGDATFLEPGLTQGELLAGVEIKAVNSSRAETAGKSTAEYRSHTSSQRGQYH